MYAVASIERVNWKIADKTVSKNYVETTDLVGSKWLWKLINNVKVSIIKEWKARLILNAFGYIQFTLRISNGRFLMDAIFYKVCMDIYITNFWIYICS